MGKRVNETSFGNFRSKRICTESGFGQRFEGSCGDLDLLPDEILVSIISSLGASSSSPTDILNATATCKKLRQIGAHPYVLRSLSRDALSIVGNSWCDGMHRYLQKASGAGNIEARFLLGTVEFYCLRNWNKGKQLLEYAACFGHVPALYSLAIINFNGSGGSAEKDKNLPMGVLLCTMAAQQGHSGALRELAHCLRDGYGITRNERWGQWLLNLAELKDAVQDLASDMPVSEDWKLRRAWNGVSLHFRQQEKKERTKCQSGRNAGNAGNAGNEESTDSGKGRTGGEGSVLNENCGTGISVDEMLPKRREVQNGILELARRLVSLMHRTPVTPLRQTVSGEQTDSRSSSMFSRLSSDLHKLLQTLWCTLPCEESYNSSKFLQDWFSHEGCQLANIRICGNSLCCRPETRPEEFRSFVIGSSEKAYCSKTCFTTDKREGNDTREAHVLSTEL